MAQVAFTPVRHLVVGLEYGDGIAETVGRLAARDNQIYFEYDASFIERGVEISPIRCPLRPGVQTFDRLLFEGLPGVFNDSLPDGWGRLLLDRALRKSGIVPEQVTALDRLANAGRAGMGALVYEPQAQQQDEVRPIELNDLASNVRQVLNGEASEVLQELIALNGSSSGARPKAMILVGADRKQIAHCIESLDSGFEPWMVKFPNTSDGADAGAIEFVYALMAKAAGVQMSDVHLFEAESGAGYFATRRFDRIGGERLHCHTACGLLHSDFRTPSLDYENLLALTMVLTKDIREVEKMYRLAVFNVLSNNRDDHGKNFCFAMDRRGSWTLAPAYDLTFASGPGGEQSTMVMGEGRSPGIGNLIELGHEANVSKQVVEEAIDNTRSALGRWTSLAKRYGVYSHNVDLVAQRIKATDSLPR